MHYLTGSSRSYCRAIEEIRTKFSSKEEIRLGPKLNSCAYLRACMNESLRISPPGGSAAWREVDQGGAILGGEFFPAGCEVGVAPYTIHHDPRYWGDPETYRPERWLDSMEDKEKLGGPQPFIPFSIGPRSCVGKPLALAQIMLTAAQLLYQFDVRRADSKEGWEAQEVFPVEFELEEHITSTKKGPILCFRARTQ